MLNTCHLGGEHPKSFPNFAIFFLLVPQISINTSDPNRDVQNTETEREVWTGQGWSVACSSAAPGLHDQRHSAKKRHSGR